MEKLKAACVNLTSPRPVFFPAGKFRIFILQLCHHPEVEGCKSGALLSAHAHETAVGAANAKHSSGMCCGSAVAARWTRQGSAPRSAFFTLGRGYFCRWQGRDSEDVDHKVCENEESRRRNEADVPFRPNPGRLTDNTQPFSPASL